MKNILILTSIYPAPDLPKAFTPVVHYFAKEWKEMGYNIKVIVSPTSFPDFYYKLPNGILNAVEKGLGCALSREQVRELHYNLDGIEISRIPIKKYLPHGTYSMSVLNNQVDKIHKFLQEDNFIPDLIIGHWINPQLILGSKLKDLYGCKFSLVLHEEGSVVKKYPDYKSYIDNVDVLGYRSCRLKDAFSDTYGIEAKFQCPSGIPNSFFTNVPARNWQTHNRYIYVGTLIKRKFPDVVINALRNHYKDSYFTLNIFGEGILKNELTQLIGNDSRISLRGRKNRDELVREYDNSDIFVMISRNEVFGLVYLEAMARGCIVIASKGEGVDGIIRDGENGFLCSAGNIEELEQTLKKIEALSIAEKNVISQNAQNTASLYSDKNVASDYLNSVIKYTGL